MPRVILTLDDELFSKLQASAKLTETDIESFLATKIHQHSAQLLQSVPQQWMPREQWDALVNGENCQMCNSLQADEYMNAYGYTVADLRVSRLRLCSDQFTPGYCILISKTHVSEIYHLPYKDQIQFFEDIMEATQAIERAYHPIKMNLEILGNALPHLHCHIKPRYYGDAAPGHPLHSGTGTHFLSTEEYENSVFTILEALKNMSQDTKKEQSL